MSHIAQYVLTHGALALFAWIFVEQAGVPIPTAPILLAIGSLAGSECASVIALLGASFGACLAADVFRYGVGRTGWSGSRSYSPGEGTKRARVIGLIRQHTAGALLPAKFISCSNIASLMAGRASMGIGRFLAFDCIASLLWAGGYIAIGYVGGNHIRAAAHISTLLLFLVGALAVWLLAKFLRSLRRPRLHAAFWASATVLLWGTSMVGIR